MLKVNDGKTEIMVLTRPRCNGFDFPPLKIETESIFPSNTVTLLGVELNNVINLENHFRNVTKGCFFKLQYMYKMLLLLKMQLRLWYQERILMVHSMITSKLDYCNAIIYGLPNYLLNSLCSVQKTAARFITGTKKFEHITPSMRELQWLPIRRRVEFKILVCTQFNVLMGKAPVYLSELLQKRHDKDTFKERTGRTSLCPRD